MLHRHVSVLSSDSELTATAHPLDLTPAAAAAAAAAATASPPSAGSRNYGHAGTRDSRARTNQIRIK
jgi:hypothetical protein